MNKTIFNVTTKDVKDMTQEERAIYLQKSKIAIIKMNDLMGDLKEVKRKLNEIEKYFEL